MKRALSDWEVMFRLLDDGDKTVDELTTETGLKRKNIYVALRRLEKYGMARITGWGERKEGSNQWPMKWGLGDRLRQGVQRGA